MVALPIDPINQYQTTINEVKCWEIGQTSEKIPINPTKTRTPIFERTRTETILIEI